MEHGSVPVRRVDGADGLVGLTVDDCDDPVAWGRILDVLASSASPATFFPSGMRVEAWPELARRSLAEGHALGSHSYDHARLRGRPPAEVRRNLARDRAAWREAVGRPPTLFRPPYGGWDAAVVRAAEAVGYPTVVLWDVDPQDWRRPPASAIVDRILGDVQDGSIVALHAVPETAAALPAVLPGLEARGLAPVTVPRLLNAGPPEEESRRWDSNP